MLAHLTVAMFTLTLIPVHVEFELQDVPIKNIQCIKAIQELRIYFTLNTWIHTLFFIYKAQHAHKVKLH